MQVECSPVTITSYSDELSAQAFANALQENGIAATVQGGFIANFRGGGPGNVSVLVAEKSVEQARLILASIREARNTRVNNVEIPGAVARGKSLLTWTFLAINVLGLACYLAYIVLSAKGGP